MSIYQKKKKKEEKKNINGDFLSNRINSQDTLDRIREASIEALPTDQDLVIQSDYIVCVVITAAGLARHGTTYGQDHDDIHGFPRFINNLPKAD